MTRKERLLDYLKENKTLTSLEAIRLFGETRLSARIYDLKKNGYRFNKQSIRVPTRDGWTYVAQYTYEGAK